MSNHPEPHDLLPLRFVTCRIAIAPPSLSLKSVSGYQCSPRCASATFSSSSFFAFSCMRGLDLSRSTFFQIFSENMKIISGFSPAFTIAHYNVADIIGHLSGLSDTFVSALKISFRIEPSFSFHVLSPSAALSLLWPSMQPALRLGHLYLFLLLCFLLHEGTGLEQNHFHSFSSENYNVDFQQHYYSALYL